MAFARSGGGQAHGAYATWLVNEGLASVYFLARAVKTATLGKAG